ncbi:transient receptor potential cation channel subfamily M member 1-like [Mytilus trossulus]|uniref:transient receptor potential cation channel subfamily M member 1-like n=1 Tax=Mytilus trossulus TaxID=6551 RepID=UPI0030050B76
MTELYRIDRKEARDMLVTKVKRYNSTTILEISEKFTLMKFMGHAACQTKLNKIWKGHISTNTSNIKAIIAAFIPIFIMKVVKTDNKVGPQKPNGTTSEVDTKWPDWRNIYYFYNSPMIKFLFHVLTYMAMLVIFCMFILTDLHPMSEKYPSVYEYIVYAMAGSLMIEETRQAFVIKQVSWNLMTWFSFWTLFEILMYSMFITSVFLRLTLSVGKFYHTRMTYAITLGLFIVNGMQFFLASRHIGPKVIMIGRMMYDIIFFILIFAVFVFGFGVIYQATMYPNSTLGFQLFKEIIYMPYWQLYGELFLAEFEGKEPSPCSHDVSLYSKGTIARCPEVNQINTLLLAIYMVVTHIILVNILIAMFSNTFTKVQDNNELVWKFHRYSLVQEYYDKSMLIPPLIIISHMFKIIMCMYNACRGITNGSNMFKLKRPDAPNKLEKKAVYNYFNLPARMRRYHAKNMEAEKDGLEASYEQDTELSLQEQFDLLSSDMDSMQENQLKTLQAINQLKEKQQKLLIVDVNSKTEGQIFVPVEMPITRSK